MALRRPGIVAAVAVVFGAGLLMPAAQAKTIDGGSFDDTFVDTGIADYCPLPGYPSLTIDRVEHLYGTYSGRTHGDGLAYFWNKFNYHTVRSNPLNGHTLTSDGRVISKDVRVTDNGDGTLTIAWIAVQSEVNYDQNHRLVGQWSNQTATTTVVDDNGTPGDPFDDGDALDEWITKVVGHDPGLDWCAVVHQTLG